MRSKFKICDGCKEYTLEDVCPTCGSKTRNPLPPAFSPEDPYGKYRRMMKKTTVTG